MLLLPSNGKSTPFYRRLKEALARRGAVLDALTLPGFDGTPPLPDPSWQALVEHCRPFLRPDQIVVGHSLGGMLAAQLAKTGLVHRLVLMEPAITPVPALAGLLARTYRKGAIDDGRTEFVNAAPGFTRLHDPDRYPPDAMADAMRCDRTTDRATLHALASGFAEQRIQWDLPARVLLIRGASSGWLMHAAQLVLARRFSARRITLSNAGHWMANEVDDALAEAILSV